MDLRLLLWSCTLSQLWMPGFASLPSNVQDPVISALSDGLRISARDAKSFLRPHSRQKRGWGSTVHGMTRGEETYEKYREFVEDQKELARLQDAIACTIQCWDPWGEWTACSHKCNSGTRMRSRNQNIPPKCRRYACPGPASETQTCRMQCGAGGTPNDEECVCENGYHGECCHHKVQCQKPRKPDNGHLENIRVWPADYGSVVSYTCDVGYALSGPTSRTCTEHGTWTGQSPSCSRIECPGVPVPEHGSLINERALYFFGDQLGYNCDLGYYLTGLGVRRCVVDEAGHGSWDVPAPTCQHSVCGDPGSPRNGGREGDTFTYGHVVKFTCNRGHSLIGSEERTCLPSGKWSGQQPECKEIRCPSINSPENGRITTQRTNVDSLILFACDQGYELVGTDMLRCLLNGTWDGTAPTCEAISCGDPGKPQHGTRRDNGFNLGQDVTFSCFSGYVLHGSRVITCMETRRWSGQKPQCRPCPRNYYQTLRPTGGETCSRCPRHSFTVAPGSSSLEQCLCQDGFIKLSNGTCKAIECPSMQPPENGVLLSCGKLLGEECQFACADGFVVAYGSTTRMCRENGQWDGKPLQCVPCPLNTYKASSGSCLPCPVHSKTLQLASMKNDCICDVGFEGPPGGPCVDFDECEINNGTGPCEQACENLPGKFKCTCTVPGYEIDEDKLKCFPATTCKNLTQDDAPANGGLVCHWYHDENSQRCALKCNSGYEFPARINNYETCGPVTGFKWSYKQVNESARLAPCIEEFFPDFRIEADSAYFVRACHNLTEDEKDEVKREFAQVLTDEGVCWARRSKVCDMRNVGIICGRVRRKRGTEEEDVEVADITFDVFALKLEEKAIDCDRICRTIGIPQRFCSRHCIPAYKRYLKAGVVHARNQVETLYRNRKDRLTFIAAQRTFEASTAHLSDVITDCEPGMVAEESMCVPCQPGSMHYLQNDTCVSCPAGTHQPEAKQTTCLPCPTGMTSTEGQPQCSYCPDGFYGANCTDTCRCGHGFCNVVTGLCKCYNGWEGEHCDRDMDGCQGEACHQGVSCTDVPAPGTGFRCGPCPPGTTGDGEVCSPLVPRSRLRYRSHGSGR